MITGRPLEDLSSLPDGWQDGVIDLYRCGASDAEVKAHIYSLRGSFSNNLWDRWMKEEEQFWETIKIGRMLAKAWWYAEGRQNLKDRDFNFTGWYMQMKNRFGWKDKSETNHTVKGDITLIFEKATNEGTD